MMYHDANQALNLDGVQGIAVGYIFTIGTFPLQTN